MERKLGVKINVMFKGARNIILLLILHSANAQTILVQPYLQPGNSPTLNKEQKVVIWQTDSVPAAFTVQFGEGKSIESAPKISTAKVSFDKLYLNKTTTYLYRATLSGLKFDQVYSYKVSAGGKTIAENSFTSRTKNPQTRFAVFGDPGIGSPQQAQIAYQIFQHKPQFALVTGDMVYSYGRELEYRVRFFPYYLAAEASPAKGAPLMNSIPFYMILGNHDIYSANFDKHPDGLAYFYYNDLPLNAPVPAVTVKPEGNPELIKAFTKNTSPRFPKISNFSFDYGNVHIACLDANYYVNPLDPALMEWLINDMRSSKADWKILSYHHPAYNSSPTHYDYQIMRLLSPICEELGVDLVFTGHVHNYQRTVPLKFTPKVDETTKLYTISEAGRVDGQFKLDTLFNGKTNTRPNGIIYIVSGAGGAALYDRQISENPELWKKGPPENWAPYTAKLISDRHSFTMVETNGKTLVLKQIDGSGNVFDEITITK